ncbi:mechanosensitive ion channel domain-containing protein [Halorubellus litoreus]|uniref:Mechanosensitive ion channel domain-containing protein n=1 Tax=Halorubellus litoreus TaxID=755308 RepID=A0ABD5VID9_9EURY
MVLLQVGDAVRWLENAVSNRFVLASVVVVIGFLVGFLIGKLSRRALNAADVDDAVEGTSFERTAQSLGTSTVDIISRLSSWFVYGFAILVAVYVAGLNAALFWAVIVEMVPQLFVAVLVLVVGFVVADKAELVVSERLRGVKLPEVAFIPRVVKYSVLYVAALISLSQLGVATEALIVLLFVYFFGIVVFGVVALWDFLRSGAAGVYLLLEQPYSIGDRVRIGESEGVVQEVDLFVTRVEDDDMEYVVPNRKVLREGVARER